MKRSNQLMLESAVIASVLIMLTLGGSVVTTTIPPSFVLLQNPDLVKPSHDSSALALYYNTTLSQMGAGLFSNASFLLNTFHFVNIAPAVNATALAANADLATVNITAANATVVFKEADAAIGAKEYVNATALVNEGCSLAQAANASLADFLGPKTNDFRAESIPVSQYSKGSGLASAEVNSLLSLCNTYRQRLGFTGLELLIGSPQTAIATGGTVALVGNLTSNGAPVQGEEVLFYINGSYFGSLTTSASGKISGQLTIPYIYSQYASVQALVLPNPANGLGGATSNVLIFQILFNQTSIVVGDPPAVLPTHSFNVEGNLTTVNGAPLPDAPVLVTFFGASETLHTNGAGVFATTLTVPANATDGIYYVYARFAPQGVFGPSVNFTSIQVVHLPMNITLIAPSLSLAGLSTTIEGTASANGTAVSGANVTVDSPWGAVSAVTDASGGFKVSLPVSPFEFAFSRNVTATVVAPQPYIARGTVADSLGLFNILLVVLPVAAVAILGYEAVKLGAFEGLRKRRDGALSMAEGQYGPAEEPAFETLIGGHEVLLLYREALIMAAKKLSIRFRPSLTLREALALVQSKGEGPALEPFRTLTQAAEDLLYASAFDQARVESAKAAFAALEVHWR